MFGLKLKTVFKSRWNALLWAASILLTAYFTVPAKDEPANGEQAAKLVAASQEPVSKDDSQTNPWAIAAD